jgi:RNA polymerase sigma-70 factor (ECF subfamily)
VLVSDPDALATASVEDTAERGAWADALRWALEQLDPVYLEAFLLKYVEQLSYEEMAHATGSGVSALKMRVKRACDRLRALLEEVERV